MTVEVKNCYFRINVRTGVSQKVLRRMNHRRRMTLDPNLPLTSTWFNLELSDLAFSNSTYKNKAPDMLSTLANNRSTSFKKKKKKSKTQSRNWVFNLTTNHESNGQDDMHWRHTHAVTAITAAALVCNHEPFFM